MNKVIIINLNGNAYQLEESGYEALRAYLDAATGRLESNPDRDEILADIEQAIADKFRAFLGANKTVVATRDVESVIAEMGPVEDASGSPVAGPKDAQDGPKPAPYPESPGSPKRLYKINDGAMLCGVCNGVATHFNIDVTIVRIAFVILTLLYGIGGLLYVVMVVLVPSAQTPAEKAAAHGVPSTSQEFIRRAREGYYNGMKTFMDKKAYREWKRKFRQEMRGWKKDFRREMHQSAHQWANNWQQHWAHQPHPVFGGWVLIPILTLLTVMITLLGVFSVISLLANGSVFGIAPPAGVPVWAGIIFVIVALQIITWPLKAMRHGLYYGGSYRPGYAGPFVHPWNTFAWLGCLLLLVWFAKHHSPEAHRALENLPHELHRAADSVKEWWARQ